MSEQQLGYRVKTSKRWPQRPNRSRCEVIVPIERLNQVPLSKRIACGVPRRATSAVSSRTTRLPEIDVSGLAALDVIPADTLGLAAGEHGGRR